MGTCLTDMDAEDILSYSRGRVRLLPHQHLVSVFRMGSRLSCQVEPKWIIFLDKFGPDGEEAKVSDVRRSRRGEWLLLRRQCHGDFINYATKDKRLSDESLRGKVPTSNVAPISHHVLMLFAAHDSQVPLGEESHGNAWKALVNIPCGSSKSEFRPGNILKRYPTSTHVLTHHQVPTHSHCHRVVFSHLTSILRGR